jgi:putative PEP-CTERM system histidine kinase
MGILIVTIATAVIAILLTFAVAFRNPRHITNISFSISLTATMGVLLGDTMAVNSPEHLSFWKNIGLMSEAVMAASWLLFSVSFARTSDSQKTGYVSKSLLMLSPVFFIILLLLPKDLFFYSPEFQREKILFLGTAGFFFNLLLLVYFIMAIMNLEATLKSSSGSDRWRIKYMLLGVGGILGLSVFYYSHAILYRSIDMNLLPVRTWGFFLSFLLIGYAIMRYKLMDVKIVVSRGIFYKSITIFIVGIYLLGLGLIGQGMRYLDLQEGKNITAFLGFSGAIVLLVGLLSEKLRKNIIVFINKNFYSQKYDYRSQWLQFTQRISLKYEFDDLLSSIVEGFKNALGVKGASIWLRDKGNGQFYCAKAVDAPIVDIKPGKNITDFLQHENWILNVHEKKFREIFYQNREFIEKNKAHLLVPLVNVDTLIGFIILRENIASNYYNYEDYDLLKTLSKQSTFAILKASLTEELSEAREIEAVGKLSSFIIHDLKNAASVLSLVVQNAGEHMDNPKFQRDAMDSVAHSTERIQDLIHKLKEFPKKIHMRFEIVDLDKVVKEAVNELSMGSNIEYEKQASIPTLVDREELKKVVINILINAQDATDGKGNIRVMIMNQGNMGCITVSDNGVGMSKEFMDKKLFKPFQTTKNKGLGLGLYQCKTIINAHSGKLEVKSMEGVGTTFSIYLPIRRTT